jgi:hypothetical protein
MLSVACFSCYCHCWVLCMSTSEGGISDSVVLLLLLQCLVLGWPDLLLSPFLRCYCCSSSTASLACNASTVAASHWSGPLIPLSYCTQFC